MSTPKSSPDEPFDLVRLRELVEMMEKHGLSAVDLSSGSKRWRLRRGPAEVTHVVPGGSFAPPPFPMMMPATAAAVPAAPASPPAAAASAPVSDLPAIKSPTVGTYYESPAPGEPAFVKVGSKVTSETVVCIIEAMKVFNQITADVDGTIAEVLVKNGDPVDFGQPLFRVRPG